MNLEKGQIIVLAIIYIAYLCWVMFGGMRKKKVNLRMYVIMTVLLIYGLVKEYTGVHSTAEIINIVGILFIGFIKGIYLGHKKIVEKENDVWYIHHDGKYILIWIAFFALKVIFTQGLKMGMQAEIPLWHMILYISFYYPWRTINIFWANPNMRKEVLG